MSQAKMLHQMCQEVLSAADIKAICKNRGLPGQAASSRSLLESLFVSETGVAEAIARLEGTEIALLHLLRAFGKPVDVTFFHGLNPRKGEQWSYGTFTQRYGGVFSTVKERMVRAGILILGQARQTYPEKTNMERWEFALPVQFERYLPPLVASARRLEGQGDWQSDVLRKKLRAVIGRADAAEAADEKAELVQAELRFAGQSFRAERLRQWQMDRWLAETLPKKGRGRGDDRQYTFATAEAVVRIFSGLEADVWSDAEGLAAPMEMFCGFKVDSESVCQSGWRWGCLIRQHVDGKTWYRLPPPPSEGETRPDAFLSIQGDGSVIADLETIPLESLEHLAAISDQRAAPGGQPALLVVPNVVKLGRAAETILAQPLAGWLATNSPAFREALQTLRRRRGKTIVHENLAVARVGDLALKVALEKALGERIVRLGEDWLAFPREAIPAVTRLVAKLGHVVKEASDRGT